MLPPEVKPLLIYCRPHQEDAWKVFLQNSRLLSHLRDREITQHVITDAITFICRVYNSKTEK